MEKHARTFDFKFMSGNFQHGMLSEVWAWFNDKVSSSGKSIDSFRINGFRMKICVTQLGINTHNVQIIIKPIASNVSAFIQWGLELVCDYFTVYLFPFNEDYCTGNIDSSM